MIQDFVALDLETTGLNPVRDRILEIGAIKIKNGCAVAEYATLVDCQMNIPAMITGITGITNEMLEQARCEGKAPKAAQAVEELVEFCEDLPILGHNISFDYGFIKQNAVNLGIPFEKDGIDTLKIAKIYLSDLPSRSLEALCAHYGIGSETHHRAVEDAKAAAELYGKLIQEWECVMEQVRREKGEGQFVSQELPGVFRPQKLIYTVKKQSPITKIQKAYLIDLIKYHRITIDASIDSLTKSEASRMIDKILFTYGKIKR